MIARSCEPVCAVPSRQSRRPIPRRTTAAGSGGCHNAKLCQSAIVLQLAAIVLQLEKQCPPPIVELLGAKRKNRLVNTDTYRLLDRRCYRPCCAQRHPGAAGGKPRSAVYAEHRHRRRGPWEPHHNRAQIGFTEYKLAEHSR